MQSDGDASGSGEFHENIVRLYRAERGTFVAGGKPDIQRPCFRRLEMSSITRAA